MAEEHLIPYEKKPLAIQKQVAVPIQYEFVNQSYYSFSCKVDQNTTVRLDESNGEASQSDCVDEEYESGVHDPEKVYYAIAVASGVLSGTLSWLDLNRIVDQVELKEKDFRSILIKAARITGYKKNDFNGAVKFIQKRIVPLVEERVPEAARDSLKIFLRTLSSNASIVGFVFSILEQFTGEKYSWDEKGKIIHQPFPDYYAIGESTEDKILYAFLYWVFALLTDAALSEKAILEELSIPKQLITVLKLLSELKVFKKLPNRPEEYEKKYSEWIKKTFEEATIIDVEGNTSSFNFSSIIKETAKDLINQSVPVVINECLFRGFYFLRHLYLEISARRLESIDEFDKIIPQDILPYNNLVVSHMAVIASGVFMVTNVAGAVVRTALEYEKGTKKSFGKQFLAHVSIAGIGRFILAVANDSHYWGKDFKVIFTRKNTKEDLFENIFDGTESNAYEALSLSPIQARLLYCLESAAVKHDIKQTSKPEEAKLKEEWLKEWQQSIRRGFEYQEEDFFDAEEETLYEYLVEQGKDKNNWRWIYLLTMEFALFDPYHILGVEKDSAFKKLKTENTSRYIEDHFIRRQTVVSQRELDRIEKEYKRAFGAVSGKTTSTIITAGAAVVTVVVSGGLAFVFAPEIAVVIAGEAVVGLHGAALTSASLAFVGGGALAAGGAGMVGGTAIITGGGAILGLAGSGSASALTLLYQTPAEYWPRQGAKLITFCKVVLRDLLHEDEKIAEILGESKKALEEAKSNLEQLKKEKCGYDKEAIKKLSEYQKPLERTEKELEKIVGK